MGIDGHSPNELGIPPLVPKDDLAVHRWVFPGWCQKNYPTVHWWVFPGWCQKNYPTVHWWVSPGWGQRITPPFIDGYRRTVGPEQRRGRTQVWLW